MSEVTSKIGKITEFKLTTFALTIILINFICGFLYLYSFGSQHLINFNELSVTPLDMFKFGLYGIALFFIFLILIYIVTIKKILYNLLTFKLRYTKNKVLPYILEIVSVLLSVIIVEYYLITINIYLPFSLDAVIVIAVVVSIVLLENIITSMPNKISYGFVIICCTFIILLFLVYPKIFKGNTSCNNSHKVYFVDNTVEEGQILLNLNKELFFQNTKTKQKFIIRQDKIVKIQTIKRCVE